MVNNFDDILRFLTNGIYRMKFNWFYNIKFDFESIIKHLPKEILIDLYLNKTIMYHNHKIFYLDKKFFSIIDAFKNRYYFYDLYNFLDTSLDKASRTMIGDSKIDTIDSSKLNKDLNYWNDNLDEIIRYCIHDATLTEKLAYHFWDLLYEKMKFIPKRPFSKGKISEEYFSAKCYIPTINDIEKPVLEYAYNSYSGGRFEILKRGYFKNVYSYDIKSAYPAEIRNLIDFNLGFWESVKECSPDADVGFYRCKVISYNEDISPFMLKLKSLLNIYPNGQFTQYLSNKEISFIEKYFPKSEIEIQRGYEFYADTWKYPFQEEIDRLYQWKESEKNPDIKYCVKIILNSLYGKTIQTVGGNTGKLFNPIYASLITSNTRLKLLEFAYPHYKDIIAFSTDSIKAITPLEVPDSPKIGEFEKDFEGSGIILMSDIYSLWNEKTLKSKDKFRGFSLAKEKDFESPEEISLVKILESIKKDTKYTYLSKRVFHLGECLTHVNKRKLMDLNTFSVIEKTIDINGDKKRLWDRHFRNGNDALNNSINSMPLYGG